MSESWSDWKNERTASDNIQIREHCWALIFVSGEAE